MQAAGENGGDREIPARAENPTVRRRDGVQKSAGISWKRRARRRSSSRNWSFGDFCRHSCVRSSRYLLERFFPLDSAHPLVHPHPTSEQVDLSCVLLFLFSLVLHPAAIRMHSPCGTRLRARASALSSSLIEYSPLYLRMLVEIYRRSRCPFRFNLLQHRVLFPFSCSL